MRDPSSSQVPRRYEGRIALITGAGSGVGRATAARLAAEGASTHLLDVDADRLAATTESLIKEGHTCTSSECDVSDPEQVESAVKECMDAHAALHLVANNAGIYAAAPVEQIPLEQWRRVLAINLDGTFLISRTAAKVMGGTNCAITNVASVYGLIGDTFDPMAAYAASKAGVAALTRQLAIEYAGRGIRVNAICPGMVDTPMNAEWKADQQAWSTFIREKIPAKRAAEDGEIAALHAFLGSSEASYVTASLIPIDGGWSAT